MALQTRATYICTLNSIAMYRNVLECITEFITECIDGNVFDGDTVLRKYHIVISVYLKKN